MDYITITQDENDLRLDRWFKRHYPEIPVTLVQKHVRKGFIRLDEKKTTVEQRVRTGQVVRIHPVFLDEAYKIHTSPPPEKKAPAPISPEQAEAFRKLLIYKDKQVIALNKPPGLAVQGGSKIKESVDGMLDSLKFDYEERPKLVHRIDKDTSGILLLARTPAAAAILTEGFRQKGINKTYWALVKGIPNPKRGNITLPISLLSGKQGERMVPDPENGQRAKTEYRVLEQAGREMAWVELHPLTGRKHQLRVHLAEGLQTPIVGDGKYGGAGAFVEGIDPKMHLHAREIHFELQGKNYTITAPLPVHMQKSWDMLGFDI